MRIERYELYRYQLPYVTPVRWFNSTEVAADFVALRLIGEDGSRGVAEAPIKPTWGGLSARALAAVVEDLLLPELETLDVSDLLSVHNALAKYPGNPLAKMLVVNACATLSAAARRLPLWHALGGKRSVEVSWCITRKPVLDMAMEAERMIAAHGFRTIKVKGGQGFDTDWQALRDIRRAVGFDVVLTVDANGAYPATDVRDYLSMLADNGVAIAEDPTTLSPDGAFAGLVATSPIPILVDLRASTLAGAEAFIAAGATAIGVKPGAIGVVEARLIADRAKAAGVGLCSGLHAESALGSLISLQFSSALADPILPAEQSFFLSMSDQVLSTPLVIADGLIEFPDSSDFDAMVDWERLQRM